MAITLNGTTGISSPGGDTSTSLATTNLSYTGTLTGGTGVIAIGTNQIYKDASGNVGLGVTPSNWSTFKAFQVGATTALANLTTTTNLYHNSYYDGVSEKYLISSMPALRYAMNQGGIGNHAWYNAPSGTAGNAITFNQAMTLDASGNLGIGTNSPVTRLSVTKDGNTYAVLDSYEAQQVSNASIAYTRWVQGSGIANLFGIDTSVGICGTSSNHAFAIRTNNTERARIDTSGNLLVGTTTANGTLTVKTALTTGVSAFNVKNGASADLITVFNNGYFVTGTASAAPYNNTTASAANLYVDNTGAFFRSTSSAKYKNSIANAIHGLTEVLKLRPVTYKGNNDGDTVFGGLIAEEVHDAGLTEFVQYNDKGEPDALAYGNMVSLAFKAIQELTTRLEALEAK